MAWALVQGCTAAPITGGFTPNTCAFGSNVTIGNVILLFQFDALYGGATPTAPSKTAGTATIGSLTLLTGQNDSTDGSYINVYICTVTGSGSATFTQGAATAAFSGTTGMAAAEISGLGTALDGTAGAGTYISNSNANVTAGPTGAATASGELIVAPLNLDDVVDGGTFTVTSGNVTDQVSLAFDPTGGSDGAGFHVALGSSTNGNTESVAWAHANFEYCQAYIFIVALSGGGGPVYIPPVYTRPHQAVMRASLY